MPLSPTAEELLSRLGASADVLVQKIDLVRDAALLVAFDAGQYRAASFLDDRILTATTKGGWVRLKRVTDAARAVTPLPLHFIFHAGHVGSTLLSRLIDESGSVLGLREPLPLRQLAEAHDVLGMAESLLSEAALRDLTDALLKLWGRGSGTARAVVLKATSSAGRLAPLLLARLPEARAVYLNVKPEPYLATLLAGANSPADLRGHGPERMRRLRAMGVPPAEALHELSLGELAALGWLAERLSQRVAEAAGGARIVAVDFDRFLDDVAGEVERVASHLWIPHDAQFAARAAASPALTRYAKAPEHAYSPALRAQVLNDARARHREEIRKGLAWLQRMAAVHPAAAAAAV